MHRPGHWGAALLVYAPLAFVAVLAGAADVALLGGAAAVALAMVPDLDQRVPGVRHRGPTHTAWFALAVGVATGVAGGVIGAETGLLATVALAVFGFLVGAGTITSHILADALTPAGVRPFAPRGSRRYSYDVARASNPLANYALLALGGGVAGAALWFGDLLHRAF
jgi:inner membrane protein